MEEQCLLNHMKIIKTIKNLAKRNKVVVEIHRMLTFLRGIPVKDYLNFRKLTLIKKVYSYTMVSYLRLSNVYELAKLIEKNKIEGVFVECGVWKGGCAALMGVVADRAKSGRKVWLFDSFEGLPEPTDRDEPDKKGVEAKEYTKKCLASLEDVERIFFSILKINKENVVIRKGWFQETVPKAKQEIGSIALLRLDADWYESTKCCLDNLYDNVISGGYIVIDDYGFWGGCKKAVGEFLESRKLNVDLINIDNTGVYFQKLD